MEYLIVTVWNPLIRSFINIIITKMKFESVQAVE